MGSRNCFESKIHKIYCDPLLITNFEKLVESLLVFQEKSMKLVRRILLLSILIASLGLLMSTGGPTATAQNCCSVCGPERIQCDAGCGGDRSCLLECFKAYAACEKFCDPGC